ncbi:MAG TPA: PAC2 family protein [Acidimicrobiales bacterium]|nr:PAC2 family protein [Acidimicrobiales bacterium]
MADLYELTGEPAPERPVVIAVLEGWVDAGLAARTALAALVETIEFRPYAVFDDEELIDLRARRPQLRIVDGVAESLTFERPVMQVGTDRLGSGILLLSGPEPDFRWRRFSAAVLEIAQSVQARMLIGLGGFPAGAPHTRPVRLAATASTSELARLVGYVDGTIEVPAGVQAALERAFAISGIPAVGLWARVPHYVSAMPFAPAAVSLLDGIASVSGLVIDSHVLAEAAEAARKKVDELINQSPEHAAMVRQLETNVDVLEGLPGMTEQDVPSGDELAAELERYLRGEGGTEPGEPH